MSENTVDLKRGDYAKYREYRVPLRIESDVFEFNGRKVVIGRLMYKAKSQRNQGIYAVSSLREYQGYENK